jgi:hypothetical protein
VNLRYVCSKCPGGRYSADNQSVGVESCLPCPANTWSGDLTESCQQCPSNSNSPVATTFIESCTCNPGAEGLNGHTCVLCTTGKYKISNGTALCQDCAEGKYSGSVGAALASTCLACPDNSLSIAASSLITACVCNAGYTGANGGECAPCAAGKYKTVPGTAACTDCASGLYSTAVAADNSNVCLQCVSNSNSVAGSDAITRCLCNMGWVGSNGGPCEACVAGKYKDVIGSAACTNCSANQYATALAATSSSVCQLCLVNSNSPAGSNAVTKCLCNPGWFGADGFACTACLSGKFKILSGSSACIDCLTGKYSTTASATSSDVCTNCPAWSNSPAGSNSIDNCICWAGYSNNAPSNQPQEHYY